MLKVTDLKVKYGMIEAIKGISFEVRDGEIVTMIGANGAGKTTTMHAISGLVKAAEGSIKLDDVELTKTPANKIVGMGLAQVPEGRRVFAEQTVEENLILGAYLRKGYGQSPYGKAFDPASGRAFYGTFTAPRIRDLPYYQGDQRQGNYYPFS